MFPYRNRDRSGQQAISKTCTRVASYAAESVQMCALNVVSSAEPRNDPDGRHCYSFYSCTLGPGVSK